MKKRKDFLVFGSPAIEEDEIRELVDTLRSGWLGTGPKVELFQKAFRDYIGSDCAIALNSCTAALHLSMIVVGLKTGDEVITSPLTFCATANAIIHAGGKPVFIDIDKNSMNMNAGTIESKITPRTKGIIPVHFAGRPCDMNKIMRVARKHKLFVIEDAAHCVEGSFMVRKLAP